MSTHFHKEGEPCNESCGDAEKIRKRICEVFEIPEESVAIHGGYAEVQRRTEAGRQWFLDQQAAIEEMAVTRSCVTHGKELDTSGDCVHCEFINGLNLIDGVE